MRIGDSTRRLPDASERGMSNKANFCLSGLRTRVGVENEANQGERNVGIADWGFVAVDGWGVSGQNVKQSQFPCSRAENAGRGGKRNQFARLGIGDSWRWMAEGSQGGMANKANLATEAGRRGRMAAPGCTRESHPASDSSGAASGVDARFMVWLSRWNEGISWS